MAFITKYFTDLMNWIRKHLSNPEILASLFWIIVKIILIYVVARVCIKIADKTIAHMMAARDKSPLKFDRRRTNTIGSLIHNLIAYTVNLICIMLILGQVGLNLGPLLAGAGVLGLAIGFGAQSLVKDVITGFFIIFEDQFGVGDVIQIDSFKGTVEEIGIRVTRIKSWTGEVHIIPNGNIKQVTNFSTYNSLAVVDVTIPHHINIDDATQILKDTVKHVQELTEDIVKEPEVLGVQVVGTTDLKIRIIAECKPTRQFNVTRLLNIEIKKRLDSVQIETM
ncbi:MULTISPECIES: mechanosensitive ion channel family protein [Paenibacillus]|uniref:Mechanosensitive ion channel n=1 Tax=Paenibacillus violae TaxID=3077234 RepID=A0ABU3RJ71_9BACL|nr:MULTISPECIES: mechanosensitive ion channel domain-containing protein [Paenibacillus]MDU0204325.1 mechanosensitive ion channel [Paenibacillus sp. PFR10]MEC0268708.1 mechanosensitive ion channel [Paenibacillus anseongense]